MEIEWLIFHESNRMLCIIVLTHFHKKDEHSVALSVERVYIPVAIPSGECSIHRHVFYKQIN